MKYSLIALTIFLIFGVQVHAAERDGFKFYVGGGDSHAWGTATETGGTAQLSGEYYALETGVELPFSTNFGMNIGGEIGQENLINSYSSSTYLEMSQLTTEALKLGLYFSHFGIGGGYRVASLTLNSVSSTSGGASATMSGAGQMGYANLSFDIGTRARGAIEAQYNSMSASTINLTNFSVGLRFYLLFSGGDR